MSLDPRIALEAGNNVPKLDPAGSMLAGANAQAQIIKNDYSPQLYQQKLDTGELANDATRMVNDQAARELATKKRLAAIAAANSKVDKSTGKITVDHNAIANQAASEGMDAGTVFKYLQAGQERTAEGLKQGNDQNEAIDKVLDPTINILRVQTDPQKAVQAVQAAHKIAVDTLVKGGVDPQAAEQQVSARGQQKLGLTQPEIDPVTGQPDLIKAGQHLIEQAKAYGQATISPQQAEVNAQNNASNYTDPDFRSGTYGDNKRVTAFGDSLIAQNLAAKEDLVGLTGKQIYDRYGEAAKSNQPTGQQRIDASKAAGAVSAKQSVYSDALAQEHDLVDKFGTKAGSFTTQQWNKYIEQNPKAARAQAAIDQYNIDNPGANVSIADGWPSVFARLRQGNNQLSEFAKAPKAVTGGNRGIANATKDSSTPAPAAEASPTKPKLSPAEIADHRRRAMSVLQRNGNLLPQVRKVFKDQTGEDL